MGSFIYPVQYKLFHGWKSARPGEGRIGALLVREANARTYGQIMHRFIQEFKVARIYFNTHEPKQISYASKFHWQSIIIRNYMD